MRHPDAPVGPVPPGRDGEEYDRMRRRVLWSMPTGLFVVGSRTADRRNLMTCNWVMQVATAPKLVAASVEVGSVTEGLVGASGRFSVSILPRSARSVVRRFVKPVDDVVEDGAGVAVSMQGEPVREVLGLPVLAVSAGWLACEVRLRHQFAEGSHALFVGEVVDAGEAVGPGDAGEVLRMEDTRMNYGG